MICEQHFNNILIIFKKQLFDMALINNLWITRSRTVVREGKVDTLVFYRDYLCILVIHSWEICHMDANDL